MRVIIALACAVAAAAAERDPVRADPLQQAIIEATRALIVTQTEQGRWGAPRGPAAVITPPRRPGAEPPQPGPDAEHAWDVPVICAAAESLHQARRVVPEAAQAAERAQALAARALLADPGTEIPLDSAIAFLRAQLASGRRADDATAAAAEACKRVVEDAAVHSPRPSLRLGWLADGMEPRIDLERTWLASAISQADMHAWLPAGEPPWPRVARLQALLPDTMIEGPRQIPAPTTFEDGTAYAAAMAWDHRGIIQSARDHSPDELLAWLQPLCEAEDPAEISLRSALAYLEAFTDLTLGQEDGWWDGCLARWTDAKLRQAQRQDTPSGPVLTWVAPAGRVDAGNALPLRWLIACRSYGLVRDEVRWSRRHIHAPLGALVATQRPDGTWPSDAAGGLDPTALAGLALLGVGYDHQTPNVHRDTVRRMLDAVRATDPAAGSTRDRALRAMVLAEAFAMTGDDTLRDPVVARMAQLWSARLPSGGWSAQPGGALDWPSTASVAMAMTSAAAGNLLLPLDELTTWWRATVGDGGAAAAIDLPWITVIGALHDQLGHAPALRSRCLAALAADGTTDELRWIGGIIAVAVRDELQAEWVRRLRALPPPAEGTVETLRLLADEVVYRYVPGASD